MNYSLYLHYFFTIFLKQIAYGKFRSYHSKILLCQAFSSSTEKDFRFRFNRNAQKYGKAYNTHKISAKINTGLHKIMANFWFILTFYQRFFKKNCPKTL